MIRVFLDYERHAGGLYDITSFDDEYTIRFRPFSATPLTNEESAGARAAFVGWLGSKNGGNMPGIAEVLSDVAPKRWILNWPGIANTAIAVVGWPLFVLSLGWMPPMLHNRRCRRQQLALSEGRCPRCGYEIYGLRAGVCPECGKPLHA